MSFALCTSLVALFGAASSPAQELPPSNGVVNFATCVTQSKYGKKEQSNFEQIRKQMTALIEHTEKELKDITSKLEDTEYLDSLSPKAEDELKEKHMALSTDLERYQQQFYQVLNQANTQLIQKMVLAIGKASKTVAEQKHLDCIINQEACFYAKDNLDVTSFVIDEMNRQFETDVKNKKVSDLGDDALDEDSSDFLSDNLLSEENVCPLVEPSAP